MNITDQQFAAWAKLHDIPGTIEDVRLAFDDAIKLAEQPAPTIESNSQDWRGMDGATAWHLIDRHADGWADVGKMMGEWLVANQALTEQPAQQITEAQVEAALKAAHMHSTPESRKDMRRAIEAAHNIKDHP